MKITGLIISILIVIFTMLFSANSHALMYTGGDWSEANLNAENGDYFSGVFTNIHEFVIPEGATVYAGSENIEISADIILIYGDFDLRTQTNHQITLVAYEKLELFGTIWVDDSTTELEAGTGGEDLTIPGAVDIAIGGGGEVTIPGGGSPILPDTSPVPEPTTMFLLLSGFVGLVGFKRRCKK